MIELIKNTSDLLMNGAGYTITIIEDEEPVALAASISNKMSFLNNSTPLFNATLITMLVLAVIAAVVVYFIQCRQLQIRISTLLTEARIRKGHYSAWNYKSLKEECARLEYLASARMMRETV